MFICSQRQAAKKEQNPYMTRAMFEEQMKSQRAQSADAGENYLSLDEYNSLTFVWFLKHLCRFSERGVIPTRWQKFCLVITRMYQSQSEIPQYVANGTMNRMHDRMRVVFICVAVICFFVLFFYFESRTASKIARDRDAIASRNN
ncbi:unnamed protein product [Strongylus vulgaris]|uniref:Uncharacterized protein n=1 Tax=Strongylus vulgaris TaxID=40348 RepID=A0A3P7IPL9_STRVU|nr:unnamed protein product [Strongylus vulgaris]